MAYKVTFFIGLNDKDTKQQRISTDDARRLLCKCIVKYFEFGGTLSDCYGVYRHCDGSNVIVLESSFKVEILFFDNDFETRCSRFAAVVKRAFNQESILQTVCNLDASFI